MLMRRAFCYFREKPLAAILARPSRLAISPASRIAAVAAFAIGRWVVSHLTMRMQMRRFTRLTNAFSKKFENHMHMVALYTVWYNYVKQHKTLKGISPAMAAGISETLWSMTDLAGMVDETAPKPGRRGPYKKTAAQISN